MGASRWEGRKLAEFAKRLWRDERGATMAEYVIVTGLVGLVVGGGIAFATVSMAKSFAFTRYCLLSAFP